MRIRGRVRPSKATSTMGFVVGLVFLGLGLFVVIPLFGIFGVIWTGIALVITAYHAVNAFSENGIATEVFEMDRSQSSSRRRDRTAPADYRIPHPSSPAQSVEERLQKLDHLKAKGLINAEEHQAQRGRILNEL